VNFTLAFELKQEAGHNLKLKYEWPQPNAEDYELKECETAALRDWNLLQIEGEEPLAVEEPVAENAKPSPTKKGAAGKKDPKAVEEITDNRPRVVNYTRNIAEESGGAGMRFTEPIITKFVSQILVIHVI